MSTSPPKRSAGTLQSRRVPQPWPQDRPFRILAIDGGGICGILPASILAGLEQRYLGGESIGQYFDLIAGTSTGGIIALGLAHGLSAADIRDVYLKHGNQIFPDSGGLLRRLRRVFKHAYDSVALEEQLRAIFGPAVLNDAKVRLCIPSFEGLHGEPWIFKTPHHPDYQLDRVQQMVRVALATSAAPTFLKALPLNGYRMVDGGLWANNPVMNAIVDALACFEVDRSQLRVLSLGCGERGFTVDESKMTGGLFQWRHAFAAASHAQSLNALGQAYLLAGKPNVIRLDRSATTKPIALDDHRRASGELPQVAAELVDLHGDVVSQMFLTEPTLAYSPYPTNCSSA